MASMIGVRPQDALADDLRIIARNLDGFQTKFYFLVLIAIVTKEREDIEKAITFAKEHKGSHKEEVARSLMVLTKVLAKAGKFEAARDVASEIYGAYWKALAWIYVSSFSGRAKSKSREEEEAKQADRLKAEGSIGHITHANSQNQASQDLDLVFTQLESVQSYLISADLKQLVDVMKKLQGFNTRSVTPQATSASFRLMVESVIARIFFNLISE